MVSPPASWLASQGRRSPAAKPAGTWGEVPRSDSTRRSPGTKSAAACSATETPARPKNCRSGTEPAAWHTAV